VDLERRQGLRIDLRVIKRREVCSGIIGMGPACGATARGRASRGWAPKTPLDRELTHRAPRASCGRQADADVVEHSGGQRMGGPVGGREELQRISQGWQRTRALSQIVPNHSLGARDVLHARLVGGQGKLTEARTPGTDLIFLGSDAGLRGASEPGWWIYRWPV
jgi:hypothetical protein